MKKLICFLLLTALVLSVTGCSLGGKTLYLPETVKVCHGGELDHTITYHYDDNGFLKQITRANSEQSRITNITCDQNGNVLTVSVPQPLEASLLSNLAYTYTYSTRGNLLSETYSVNGLKFRQTQWEYNTKNQIVRAVHWDTSQNTTMEYRYEYDGGGKLLAIHGYREGTHVSETTFVYDETDRMIRETLCNDRGIVIANAEYRYEDGKTFVILTTNRIGKEMTVTYAYDHAGNLLEEAHGEGSYGYGISYVYTYREVKVSGDSPRRSYTGLQNLPATGLTTPWQ